MAGVGVERGSGTRAATSSRAPGLGRCSCDCDCGWSAAMRAAGCTETALLLFLRLRPRPLRRPAREEDVSTGEAGAASSASPSTSLSESEWVCEGAGRLHGPPTLHQRQAGVRMLMETHPVPSSGMRRGRRVGWGTSDRFFAPSSYPCCATRRGAALLTQIKGAVFCVHSSHSSAHSHAGGLV